MACEHHPGSNHYGNANSCTDLRLCSAMGAVRRCANSWPWLQDCYLCDFRIILDTLRTFLVVQKRYWPHRLQDMRSSIDILLNNA